MVVGPRVYLRVGGNGSGHTSFIKHVSKTCDLQLFTKPTMTAFKIFHGRSSQFLAQIHRYKEKKMLAFDNIRPTQMCQASCMLRLRGSHDDHMKNIDTYVFSINDTGMKSCGEVTADDVLTHAFGTDGLKAHRHVLYNVMTEIHHMLPDGTVRVLACAGEKLVDPLVLTQDECNARVTKRGEGGGGGGSVWR
jgi:hypothetical protein